MTLSKLKVHRVFRPKKCWKIAVADTLKDLNIPKLSEE